MKRKPHLYKLTFRASAEVKTWLDDQAKDMAKENGIKLTEARGVILTSLVLARATRPNPAVVAPAFVMERMP